MAQTSSKKRYPADREWYLLRSLLGYNWASLYFMLGGWGVGKSFAVMDWFVGSFAKNGNPFVWLRISDTAKKKILANNAKDLIEDMILKKHGLSRENIMTNGDVVYYVTERNKKGRATKKVEMCKVLALQTYYNDKGRGFFDVSFLQDHPDWKYHICLDEMNRETGEKKSVGLLKAFGREIETLTRNAPQDRVKIFCIGNLTSESCELLAPLNFIPTQTGRYYFKKPENYPPCLIEFIENNEAANKRNKKKLGMLIASSDMEVMNRVDLHLDKMARERLVKPTALLKFSDEESDWYTVWESVKNRPVIRRYKKESICKDLQVSMKRHISSSKYYPDVVKAVFETYDMDKYKYADLNAYISFRNAMTTIRAK